MAQLTAEQQAKVDALLKKSRILYEAILASKPPTDLGLALRDGLPFERLKDESVGAIALTVSNYEKGLLRAVEELAKVPDVAPSNGAAAPSGDAPAVTPAKQKKDATTSPKP